MTYRQTSCIHVPTSSDEAQDPILQPCPRNLGVRLGIVLLPIRRSLHEDLLLTELIQAAGLGIEIPRMHVTLVPEMCSKQFAPLQMSLAVVELDAGIEGLLRGTRRVLEREPRSHGFR